MLKQKINSKRGFTIIEVVLVLAIAGLIFLMVFLALPALQRSQRDTERRNKLGEFRTQVIQYQSNNRGRVPQTIDDWERVVDDYMNQSKTKFGGVELTSDKIDPDTVPFLDPDGERYYIASYRDLTDTETKENPDAPEDIYALEPDTTGEKVSTTGLTWDANKHQIYVFRYARCDGDNVMKQEADGSRLVVFVTKLEGSGVYCGEN
ncbi:MAG: type II secretion system protein [Candidatus Saccharibacteria bacterium]|nr:type II secretion system protein [Candidatus Saccharibacteria bacterium]